MAHALSSSELLTKRRVLTRRGPWLVMWFITLPPLTVGMWYRHGFPFVLGLVIALGWIFLLPIATWGRRPSALVLPVFAAITFLVSVLGMPFGSAAFWVYSWSTAAMLLMTIPKIRRTHWEEHLAGGQPASGPEATPPPAPPPRLGSHLPG
jgi:hypothetical protein